MTTTVSTPGPSGCGMHVMPSTLVEAESLDDCLESGAGKTENPNPQQLLEEAHPIFIF